ncbi:hypothetical protein [Natranaerobius thermophilus]|uniref:Uncharacterized protein n=2 Tax=Natranaerobius TaxID=375928 RepID=B2A7U6_NATTJ|nr:hypothetical protein [Natranaerobius thermophilus]ACB84394.1 hypothetical protein Nther_0808 [Natranaerobius thermophilus JW/NM-WN-LF]
MWEHMTFDKTIQGLNFCLHKFSGWADAVKGSLYNTIHTKKTHANMGNLFGWIYGDQPKEFKEETWKRYIENSN